MRLICIDPGTIESGVVVLDASSWPPAVRLAEVANHERTMMILAQEETRSACCVRPRLLIEKIESYGMAVGAEVFETVFWSGAFAQQWGMLYTRRIPRRDVKLGLCGSPRAKDANIRQAILDIYGGKVAAVGTKKAPGPLYGVKSHAWAALAVGLTYMRQAQDTTNMPKEIK